MCGITGFIGSPAPDRALAALGQRMADAIRHRGPDDEGLFVDAATGLCLAQRRLAIIDLSPAGHQPMHSANGHWVLVFNGEIYNHLDLRAELQSAGAVPPWRGHSDTETLLAAIECWGLEASLHRVVGMFAFALWHRPSRTLHLGRDRFGEKPLYYGWVGRDAQDTRSAFVFGSELKALRAHPGFAHSVRRDALALYLRYLAVPAPYSIHEGIFKLEPGCLLTLAGPVPTAPTDALRPPAQHGSLRLSRWWRMDDLVTQANAAPLPDTPETLDQLEAALARAVREQSLADVPLGAFLSGGVDSSAIVALMQSQSSRPVKTFTIGFDQAGYDEAPFARAVAEHLGTEHHELRVTAQDALALVPSLPTMYDEPFADSSQIPTHLVCRAARQHVTVALSGDAGDEVFGGYNRYLWAPALWRRVGALPHPLRQALSAGLGALPTGAWDTLLSPWNRQGSALGVARVGEKLHKLSRSIAGVRSLDDVYRRLVSEWQHPAELVIGSQEPPIRLDDPCPVAALTTPEARMMFQDSVGYLPDDILCKVDRAAMAISLETRVPFLDHRVVELAWRLPARMKLRDGVGKWALRELLYRRVPRQLIERPKTGFAIPLGDWLRGPLKAWAQDLLDPDRLRADGLLEPEPVQRRWAAHLAGRGDHTAALWAVLMFQAWQQAQRANAVGAVS